MKFSTFINFLYKNKNANITSKDEFVIQLLESTGNKFHYSNDVAKKLASDGPSHRPLNDDIRNYFNNNIDQSKVIEFFQNNINTLRLVDLFLAFNISEEEKKDFNILVESLATQFINYLKYGENKLNTTVNSLYITLCDQYGNGSDPNANKNAVFAAKQEYYSALQNLSNLNPKAELIKLKSPFENFFRGIQNSLKIYESKCNLTGRTIYKQIRDDILKLEFPGFPNDLNINEFLAIITEPGSLPLNLVKTLKYVIYDNKTFEDKVTELSIRLFDNFSTKDIINMFKNVDTNGMNELFFTEYIIFSIDGSDRNLLYDATYIIAKFELLWNILEKKFEPHEHLEKLNNKINALIDKFQMNNISFLADGSYFPFKNEFTYYATMDVFLGSFENHMIAPGDDKFPTSNFPFFKDAKTYIDKFKNFFHWHLFLQTQIHKGDMMVELITFNDDGTIRYYMFPPTCKAKIYRKVREISQLAISDGMIGFMTVSISLFFEYSADIINMTTEERAPLGKEYLVGNAYFDDTFYTISKDLNEGMTKCEIISSKQITSPVYVPLINEIKKYQYIKEHINDLNNDDK